LLLFALTGKVLPVGFFDRAKAVFGLQKDTRTAGSGPAPRGERPDGRKNKAGRPPLPEVSGAASATIEDVLAARAAGSFDEARAILAAIDKGQGLRTVLRAAAALEAKDEDEVTKLLPLVRKDSPAWQLRLQVAAALEQGAGRDDLVARAVKLGAPGWSIAWLRALSNDDEERRAGLVDLLFEDAALARTVAARDLGFTDVKVDNDAIRRYAAFAHGRDVIRRFGAAQLVALLRRVDTGAAA
jgi:hypothetical protein